MTDSPGATPPGVIAASVAILGSVALSSKKEAPILLSESAMKQMRGGAKQRGIAIEPYGLAVF